MDKTLKKLKESWKRFNEDDSWEQSLQGLSDWDKQDAIEEKLLELVLVAKEKIGSSNIIIHVASSDKNKLKKINVEQELGPKPDGFWYARGNKWLEKLEEYPEWIAPYFYIVQGVKPLIVENNWDEIELYKESKFNWDWNNIKEDFNDYNAIEVTSELLIKKEFSDWEIPSGCVWNNNGEVTIKKLQIFDREQLNIIQKYGNGRKSR